MKRKKEPAAIHELHRIREEMLAEEKRVGSDKFWTEVNWQGKEFARRHRLKYVEATLSVGTVREKPAKRYKAR